VDGVATVVGGRNIGDEYFNAHADLRFADMDVIAVGPVVPEVAKSFDDYWNSASAFPLERVLRAAREQDLPDYRAALFDHRSSEPVRDYRHEVSQQALFPSDKPGFDWARVRLVVDDPAKGQGNIPRRKLLVTGLNSALGKTEKAILVATAYFVPGRIGARYLIDAARAGKTVQVLTNSLASNDVVPVHAGYARYRKRLLRHGVGLHELRASRSAPESQPRRKGRIPRFGASSSSLHAKMFVMDENRVFVGSFNFDPRSLYLNCEMGLMIESAVLGKSLAAQFNDLVARRCYQPFIESGNRLSWRDSDNNLFRVEPESNARQRIVAWVMSWLPVEWLL
jgi:cardiolipin synthase C